MTSPWRGFFLGTFLIMVLGGLSAQNLSTLSSQSEISVLTMGPGKEIYLAFGHSAFRVKDPVLDIDWVFNYGTFSLEDPLFIPRFVQGELNYMLSRQSFEDYLAFDKRTQNREWIEQTLNLDQDQKNAMVKFLINNARDENKYYLYDFIADNCSTRIKDALISVLGTKLTFDQGVIPGKTYRQMLDEWDSGRPLYQFLFYLSVGQAADQVVIPTRADWLPYNLLSILEGAKLEVDGKQEPLVLSKSWIYTPIVPSNYDEPWSNPAYLLWALSALVIFLTLRTSFHKPRSLPSTWSRWGDFILFLLLGICGAIIFYLEFFSLHSAVKGNLNLVWLWPTHLVAAIFLLRKKRPTWTRWYFLVTAIGALGVLLLWPFWPQSLLLSFIPVLLMIIIRSGYHFYWVKRINIEEKISR